MKEIPLTNSPLVALVDDEDFERVMTRRWFLSEGRISGIKNSRKEKQFWAWVASLRFSFRLSSWSPNLWSSLHYGQTARRINTSGYRGVAWDKANGNWMSYINAHGQRYNLGRFSDPLSAAKARDEAAKELHGDFHRTNLESPHRLSTEATRIHTKRLRRIDNGRQEC